MLKNAVHAYSVFSAKLYTSALYVATISGCLAIYIVFGGILLGTLEAVGIQLGDWGLISMVFTGFVVSLIMNAGIALFVPKQIQHRNQFFLPYFFNLE